MSEKPLKRNHCHLPPSTWLPSSNWLFLLLSAVSAGVSYSRVSKHAPQRLGAPEPNTAACQRPPILSSSKPGARKDRREQGQCVRMKPTRGPCRTLVFQDPETRGCMATCTGGSLDQKGCPEFFFQAMFPSDRHPALLDKILHLGVDRPPTLLPTLP